MLGTVGGLIFVLILVDGVVDGCIFIGDDTLHFLLGEPYDDGDDNL